MPSSTAWRQGSSTRVGGGAQTSGRELTNEMGRPSARRRAGEREAEERACCPARTGDEEEAHARDADGVHRHGRGGRRPVEAGRHGGRRRAADRRHLDREGGGQSALRPRSPGMAQSGWPDRTTRARPRRTTGWGGTVEGDGEGRRAAVEDVRRLGGDAGQAERVDGQRGGLRDAVEGRARPRPESKPSRSSS